MSYSSTPAPTPSRKPPTKESTDSAEVFKIRNKSLSIIGDLFSRGLAQALKKEETGLEITHKVLDNTEALIKTLDKNDYNPDVGAFILMFGVNILLSGRNKLTVSNITKGAFQLRRETRKPVYIVCIPCIEHYNIKWKFMNRNLGELS